MADKAPKQTVVWPATGRRLEVAAVDVDAFVADGWERAASQRGGASPDQEPSGGGGDGGEASPPAKRTRGRKSGG